MDAAEEREMASPAEEMDEGNTAEGAKGAEATEMLGRDTERPNGEAQALLRHRKSRGEEESSRRL